MNTTLDTSPQQEYWVRLDLKSAFRQVDRFIISYNQRQEDKKQHIKGSVLATLYRVAEAYVRQNNHIQQLLQQPIACRLNNCMLAYQQKVTRRTIINHLNKLQQAGIIHKTFRGTYADYEIHIPAHILTDTPQQTIAQQSTPEPSLLFDNVKKVPPISLLKHLEISNIHSKPCELVENHHASVQKEAKNDERNLLHPLQGEAVNFRDTFSGYNPKATIVGVETPHLSTGKFRGHNLAAAGGAKNESGGAEKKKYPRWQLAMVQEFYRYALPTLYPCHEFSPETEKKILNKLFNHVYGGFKDISYTPKQWETYHKSLLERVDMVVGWKERPIGKEKELSYQSGKFLVNPLTYFDIRCAYGFAQTEGWLVLKRRRMALFKAELELEKARKEVLKEGDRLRIYRKWEVRFKNKRLPEIMPMFYRAMQSLQGQLVAAQATKP